MLYDFKNAPDANEPEGGLIRAGGTLFGTTGLGGTGTDSGCGTVFGVTKAGAEHVVYSFKCGNDGEVPYGSLIEVGGAFYGTTLGGDPSMDTTVFKVTRAGAHTVLHAFSGGSDGAIPYAGLVNLNGTLYGTTLRGGANNAGTVFAITP